MNFPKKYDPADAQDILRYAKWLIGKTFYNVLETDLHEAKPQSHVSEYNHIEEQPNLLQDSAMKYGNVQRKGGLGNLIEEHFFHYEANPNSEADFSLAGLELKVTGVISGKKVTESIDVRVKATKKAGTKAPLSSRMKMLREKMQAKWYVFRAQMKYWWLSQYVGCICEHI